MKIFLMIFTFLSSNFAMAVCSYNMTKTVKSAMQDRVYQNESVNVGDEVSEFKTIPKDQLYPAINDIQACLVSWSKYIAPSGCSKLFDDALAVKSQIGDYLEHMSQEEVLFYYNFNFDNQSTGGGFVNEVQQSTLGEVQEQITYVDSYHQYLETIFAYEKGCAEIDNAAVYKDPNLNMTGSLGVATVTVYNSLNKQECKFIVNIESKNINIEVPSEYNFCVSNKDNYIVTEIVWKDVNGLLKTEFGVGGVADFVSEENDEQAKVTTSSTPEIKNTMEVLFEAIEASGGLDVSAMVSDSSKTVNFEDISSLDQDALRLGYLCDWGGYTDQSDVNFDADYNDYLFYLNDTTQAPAASPLFPSHASWYRYLYNTVLQNAILYPAVLELLNNFKAGVITDEDAYNWDEASGAYYLCYAQYQSSWWDAQTLNAITGQ